MLQGGAGEEEKDGKTRKWREGRDKHRQMIEIFLGALRILILKSNLRFNCFYRSTEFFTRKHFLVRSTRCINIRGTYVPHLVSSKNILTVINFC